MSTAKMFNSNNIILKFSYLFLLNLRLLVFIYKLTLSSSLLYQPLLNLNRGTYIFVLPMFYVLYYFRQFFSSVKNICWLSRFQIFTICKMLFSFSNLLRPLKDRVTTKSDAP